MFGYAVGLFRCFGLGSSKFCWTVRVSEEGLQYLPLVVVPARGKTRFFNYTERPYFVLSFFTRICTGACTASTVLACCRQGYGLRVRYGYDVGYGYGSAVGFFIILLDYSCPKQAYLPLVVVPARGKTRFFNFTERSDFVFVFHAHLKCSFLCT